MLVATYPSPADTAAARACTHFSLDHASDDDDKRKIDAISRLTELTIAQGRIVPIMKKNDDQAMAIVVSFAV